MHSIKLFLLLATFSGLAAAQVSVGGSISGRVTDASDAAIAGAKIIVTNTDMGVIRDVTSNQSGRFNVPNLSSGTYSVRVEAPGFQATSRTNLVLTIGQQLEIPLQMSVSSQEQSITVEDTATAVNTSQAYGSTVNQRAITELPLNGRRWEDLALLTPGVTRSNGGISVGGLQMRGMSSFNIDGFDSNTSMFGMSRGGNRPPFQMSQDAVKEFQVVTNAYSAEFGRVGGGMINAVSKSGTNAIHGSAFYFFRDSSLGARNSFAATKPEDRRQQFGASIGGAIKRNSLFFFMNTDNQKQANPAVITAGDALLNVRTVTINDVRAAFTRFQADPSFDRTLTVDQAWQNFQDARSFVERQVGVMSRRFDQVTLFPRVDWVVNNRLNLNVRYNFQDFDAPNGLDGGTVLTKAVENAGYTKVRTHTVGTQLNFIATPSTVFETRVGVAKDDQPDVFAVKGTSELRDIPSEIRLLDGRQFTFGPLNFLPRQIRETRTQIVQNVTHLRQNHVLKAGMDLLLIDQDNVQTRTARGQYQFTNLLNYAVGAYRTFIQNLGAPPAKQKLQEWAAFVQDEWKVRPGLTLNMGVRYDLQVFTQPTIVNPLVPDTARIPVDKNNFAPRFGFAWSPGKSQRNVIRGGYGISYVRTLSVDTEIFLYRNGVTRQLVTFLGPDNAAGSDQRAPVFPGIFDQNQTIQSLGISPTTVEVGMAAPNRVNAYIQHANVTLERQFGDSLTTSVGWLFLKGTHMTGKMIENVGSLPVAYRNVAIVDPSNRQIGLAMQVPDYDAARNRPNPALGDIFVNRSEYNSVYHALVVSANKRFSRNFQFTLAYTFSKSIDDNPQQEGADISAPLGLRSQFRGLSNQDQRHRLVYSGTFHQPRWNTSSSILRAIANDWQLGTILAFEGGMPYSATTSINLTRVRSGVQFAPASTSGGFAPYGRNTFTGFGRIQNDLRLTRSFAVAEGKRLEFIAEAFNVANRTNLLSPGNTLYNYAANTTYTDANGAAARGDRLTVNPNFGIATGADTAREIQFALRFTF